MKKYYFGLIFILYYFSGYSQDIWMYDEKGEKIYFNKVDSITQIKFIENLENEDKLKLINTICPYSGITINKDKIYIHKNVTSFNLDSLNRNNIILYANQSLLSSDNTLQIPTEKIFVNVKENYDLEQILNKLGIEYSHYRRLGHKKNSYLIFLLNGESIHIANTLFESGYFNYAQPCFTRFIKTFQAENDLYEDQWGLNNTGQNGGTTGIDINAEEAWEITFGSHEITIAVIDQGVDLNHPDLEDNLLLGFDATDGGAGGNNGDCWGDNAHGTACAGIIASVDNTIGTIGVAPECNILPIRVSYTEIIGGIEYQIWDDDWIVEAINRAWEIDEADIISCSWGGGSSNTAINNEISDAFEFGRNNLGCTIVFAAGNNNDDHVEYPANGDIRITAVGAMSPCGERKRSSDDPSEVNPDVNSDPQGVSCDGEGWWGSNYGFDLDLIAPGVFIPTTDIQGNAGYNDAFGAAGNYYETFNGTSAATPHVAGTEALVLSVNQGLSYWEVSEILESTAQKIGSYSYEPEFLKPNGTWNEEVGYGLVDAFAAVQKAVCGYPIENTTYSSDVSITCNEVEMTNVTVSSGAGLFIETDELLINGPFSAESGSELLFE